MQTKGETENGVEEKRHTDHQNITASKTLQRKEKQACPYLLEDQFDRSPELREFHKFSEPHEPRRRDHYLFPAFCSPGAMSPCEAGVLAAPGPRAWPPADAGLRPRGPGATEEAEGWGTTP